MQFSGFSEDAENPFRSALDVYSTKSIRPHIGNLAATETIQEENSP